jgi:FSR family fosmidomycin resistance protein-like MFS transporter
MLTARRIHYPTIALLSFAHLLNDMYSNFLPQMLPFLIVLMPGFNATQAAVLVSVFTISASFIQPIFGYILDGRRKWWLFNIGTIWMAAMLALTGVVRGYGDLVLLAALAGLGTAAFHPRASTLVNNMAGDRKAVFLSAFVAFGNLGFALSPLLLIPLFQAYGLHAAVYTVVPAVLVTLLLLFFAPRNDLSEGAGTSIAQALRSLRSAAGELSVIVAVIAIRSLAYTGLLALLPLYFKSLRLSDIAGSHLMTIMLVSGAAGGILGGLISDYYGRKRLIVGSMFLTTPLLFGFLMSHGILSVIFLGLGGAALMASFSVTVVAAQEVIPANKALAAGLSMGFAGGLGALAVVVVGRIGDIYGLVYGVGVLFTLPLAAGLVGLMMKNRPAGRTERREARSVP